MTARIQQHVASRRFQGFQRGGITSGTLTATMGVATLIIVTCLGFFYLQQVLHTASQGTDIHELEGQLLELKQEQRELELEGAQLRSLQNVEECTQKLNLAPTNRVTYLASMPEHVAVLTPE